MLNNLKISKKLLLLSVTILLLLALTVIWAALGLSDTLEKGSRAAYGNKLSGIFAQLEIKHDSWNNKVRDFLSDSTQHELHVKTDYKTCALGKWFYSEERHLAEERIPVLKAELAALEEPHRAMHLSARKIKEVYRPADQQLPLRLNTILKDHYAWFTSVQNGLLSHNEKIDVNTDPGKSSLGRFLKSAQAESAAANSEGFAGLLEKIREPHERMHHLVDEMNEALVAADRRTLYTIYDDQMLPTLEQVGSLLNSLHQLAESELKGLRQAQEIYRTATQPNLAQLKTHLHNVAKTANASIISDQQMIAAAQNTRNVIVLIGILALGIGIFLATMISRSLTVPMQKTVAMINDLENGHLDTRLHMERRDEIGQMAATMDRFAESLQSEVVTPLQQLASGDLSFRISPRDEHDTLRGSLQKLGRDLSQILLQIRNAGEQIDSGSSQVSSTAQSLSDGAAQSAASVEEISSSMNEIDSQTSTSADNARKARDLASTASEAARNGSERMAEMINAMGEINAAGEDINKIIKVIDEIAFQTNLLALNAAVEAARAGQHGKGFAVVAEEVRNLAARSAKAASETAGLIEGSVQKAGNGTRIAERTSQALEDIVDSIGQVTGLIGEIATASDEQAQGIAQVNAGMQQIDQVIQQTTASAEESAATSQKLSTEAAALKQQLSLFKLQGSTSGMPEASRPAALPAAPQPQASGWDRISTDQPAGSQDKPMLQWQDSFNTGIALMDKQHRRLVELINQLFTCMKDGGDRMLLGSVVDELVDYTVTHFRAEEDVMRKHDYPELEAHREVHQNFIEQVGQYAEKIKTGERLAPADVYSFLKDWLVNHIEKEDRDGYGSFLRTA